MTGASPVTTIYGQGPSQRRIVVTPLAGVMPLAGVVPLSCKKGTAPRSYIWLSLLNSICYNGEVLNDGHHKRNTNTWKMLFLAAAHWA
jgi:hypothetical protein